MSTEPLLLKLQTGIELDRARVLDARDRAEALFQLLVKDQSLDRCRVTLTPQPELSSQQPIRAPAGSR